MTESRNAILDVAEEIFRTGGTEALSMRRIAEARGVTATAIYRHFTGKEELLDAMAERGLRQLAAAFRRGSGKGTARVRVLAIVGAFRSFALRKPALFDLMFFTRRAGARRFPGDFERGASPAGVVFVDLLRNLGAPDPLGAALVLWATAQGLISLHRASRFESERAFQTAWDRSFDLLLGKHLFTDH